MMSDMHSHPLMQHYLTLLRDKHSGAETFRHASAVVTRLLVMKASELLELETTEVETPLETTAGARVPGPLVLVPILRAGLGMLDPAMAILPNVGVGYVGMERDEATAIASCYYNKTPNLAASQAVFVLDPMLATGGSAVQAVDQLKADGAGRIIMVCVVAAPEGIALLNSKHPDVPIVAGVIDRQLNERKYILPGLGDYGDRLFNT